MGALKPNKRYVIGWSDYRGIYREEVTYGIIDRYRPASGYDPTLRRKTCAKCNSLSWHRNDSCMECG